MASNFSYRAPGAQGYHSTVFPGRERREPGASVREPGSAPQATYDPTDPDLVAVEPETRQELLDGRIVEASPALPPHSDQHSRLDYVLNAYLAPGYVASSDMLTRTSQSWNFATDASIRKAGADPETGHRHLEELSFEIAYTQTMRELAARAQQLRERGVRRVFAVCVSGDADGLAARVDAVMEWSDSNQDWQALAADAVIEDPCLFQPVPVQALMGTGIHSHVAEALIGKNEPTIARRIAEGRAQGVREGEMRGIASLCRVLDIALTPAREERLASLDRPALSAVREHLERYRTWPE